MHLLAAIVLALLLFCLPLSAQGNGHGKGKGKGKGHAAAETETTYFRPNDVVVINRYYTRSSLPPGLQKKLARQGTLPPGWQKHYRPFPVEVESQLPPVCGTCARGYYGDYALVFDKRTAVIYDVARLVADIVR